ncbi:Hypothetical Protein FCC1311_003442 [Hondaea fermentalgiana]|uniref:Uncharacterized protein n=1 Tax=Hondaea fermentalgiana TaxID=2315210 RepID=A0A2R5FZE2_9STRA|nr:Hypothetical Protein FCC1311_003442 [Hondaea fermentalgiana]|eukprot:GBG24126.1 Hypothetical Protein FCC1311_003442 [Hondaea fermentalgiana]
MFAPGVQSDEAQHRIFCKRSGDLGAAAAATSTVPARSIRDDWVLSRRCGGKERVVVLPRGAMATKSALVQSVREFKRCVVDPDMGFVDAVDGWSDSPLRYSLIYVVGTELAGFVTLEHLVIASI